MMIFRPMQALSDNKVDDKDDEAEEHEGTADPLVHLAVHSDKHASIRYILYIYIF